jgi:hypothetical protein
MTETTTEAPFDVAQLSPLALDAEPVWFDWSEADYPEGWEYAEAPDCPACGEYARWDAEENAWRCPDEDCENTQEIDPFEQGAEGPVMSYYYPLPRDEDDLNEAASKISMLPLCVVRIDAETLNDPRGEDTYALALTGGGMDLSWEICEGFARLGYLPPVHFANLPGMAGYPRTDAQRATLDACKRSWIEHRERASTQADYALESLRRMEAE